MDGQHPTTYKYYSPHPRPGFIRCIDKACPYHKHDHYHEAPDLAEDELSITALDGTQVVIKKKAWYLQRDECMANLEAWVDTLFSRTSRR